MWVCACFFFAGICTACQRSHHQDGCKQPGHGHGSQLPALPVRWPQGDLWEHTQGDVLHTGAHPAAGHQLHGWNSIAPSLHLTPPILYVRAPRHHLQHPPWVTYTGTAWYIHIVATGINTLPLQLVYVGGTNNDCRVVFGRSTLLFRWNLYVYMCIPLRESLIWMAASSKAIGQDQNELEPLL